MKDEKLSKNEWNGEIDMDFINYSCKVDKLFSVID